MRGGILTGAALIVAGAVIGAGAVYAQAQAPAQKKPLPPLELKGEAAASPWKRYSGWPARDESKFNTLAKLSSPPAPIACCLESSARR